MTFDELFEPFRLLPEERKALVLRLAHLRYEKTVETLLPVLRNPEETHMAETYKTKVYDVGGITITASRSGGSAADKVQALIEAIATEINNALPGGAGRPDQGLPPTAGTKPIDPDKPTAGQPLPGDQPEVDNDLPALGAFLKEKAKEIAAAVLKGTLCDPAKPK